MKEIKGKDIVICMREEDFLHKTDTEMYHCYWSMGRAPRYFTENNKIFIVTNKRIVGFVECEEFNPEDLNGETLVWDGGNAFTKIEPISCKPFRGFRYRWFNYRLVKEENNVRLNRERIDR